MTPSPIIQELIAQRNRAIEMAIALEQQYLEAHEATIRLGSRVEELEAQLYAIGAGGVEGELK